ncbi:unnamed protein product [Rhizoctonia solani]|uniref:Granulins domain-containing protein n=1 Tax=Rhizoctonia solani TaxID=456999 RepID=A0A8H3B8B5_9AGAM|nr:unnamed protein product [Rhizoctonia solani]
MVTTIRLHTLASVLLALLPLVPAATISVKEGNLQARANNAFVDTSDSVSPATNGGNVAPAGLDNERRVCPAGYGYCLDFPAICCPLGGQCCADMRCCGFGFYCVLTFSGIRCCPNGEICSA